MTKLSGLVAIIRDGRVVETRDLGPDPVEVKENVLPLTIERSDTSTGEETVAQTVDDIQKGAVTRTITVRDKTAQELALEDTTKVDGALSVEGDVLKAFALMVLAEFNLHAVKINAILNAADAATSLADFKSRLGAIADCPERTIEQLKTAITAKMR